MKIWYRMLAAKVGKRFSCFGQGSVVRNKFCRTPITEALKDAPLQFAAGVDVAEVLNFVLGELAEIV